MPSNEDPKGAETPKSESSPEKQAAEHSGEHAAPSSSKDWDSQYEEAYNYNTSDPYPFEDTPASQQTLTVTASPPATASGAGGAPPPPKPPADDEEGEEEDGMLRMSFLEHLE